MASTVLLARGSTFAGRFRIVEILGGGEMGAAYVVGAPPTRRVLKVMEPALVKQDALRKRFVAEAKATAGVASAHILKTLDAGIDRETGRPWFTTDLLEGGDLSARVSREGRCPLPEVARILTALGDALGKAHALGLVHYDLTPENVHFDSGSPGAIKLRELTISRLVSDACAAEHDLIGTAIWMPPEQFEVGHALTPAANVWSLGLLAFYAATGRPYWTQASDDPAPSKALLREILSEPLAGASERATELGCQGVLPANFDAWFARCVTREPADRFAEARAAHVFFAEKVGVTSAAPPRRKSERPSAPGAVGVPDDPDRTTPWLEAPTQPKARRNVLAAAVAEAKAGPASSPPPPPPTESAPNAAAADRPAPSGKRRALGALALLPLVALLGVWLLRNLPASLRAPAAAPTRGALESATAAAAPLPAATVSSPVLLSGTGVTEGAQAGAIPTADGASPASPTPDAAGAGPTLASQTFSVGEAQGDVAPYDVATALKALNRVYYGGCTVPSSGKLAVTFAPIGRVKKVVILQGDYDAETASCLMARFGTATLPPFRGGPQTVTGAVVPTR
jgi:serine/threonine protein kinase